MNGQAFRAEPADLRQRVRKHGVILAGERRDNVHVDVVKADASGQLIRLHRLLRGVRTADSRQRRVVHRLRIDADPRHGMVAEHAQLLCVQRVRPTGLNGKFRQRAEMLFNMCEQAVKLWRGQTAGGSAADIAHADMQPHLSRHLGARLNLMQQRR